MIAFSQKIFPVSRSSLRPSACLSWHLALYQELDNESSIGAPAHPEGHWPPDCSCPVPLSPWGRESPDFPYVPDRFFIKLLILSMC